MVEDTVVLEHCYICSKALRNGDSAAGLTRGSIDENTEGFLMDYDTPWEVIICPRCTGKLFDLLHD